MLKDAIRVAFIIVIDEDLYTSVGKESGPMGEMPHAFFPTKSWSSLLAWEPFMKIHKAVSRFPLQPPMRTQVKPHSLQPPNLPQWTGETLGRRFWHIPWPQGMFLELDGTRPGSST